MIEKYKLLTKFANDLPQAYDINVVVKNNSINMKSKTFFGANKDDADVISQRVDGAQQLLSYLEDNGYEIVKKSKSIKFPIGNRDRK